MAKEIHIRPHSCPFNSIHLIFFFPLMNWLAPPRSSLLSRHIFISCKSSLFRTVRQAIIIMITLSIVIGRPGYNQHQFLFTFVMTLIIDVAPPPTPTPHHSLGEVNCKVETGGRERVRGETSQMIRRLYVSVASEKKIRVIKL